MKLTKLIREAFVRAAMHDVPTTDFKGQAEKLAHKHLDETFASVFSGAKITRQEASAKGWLDKTGVYLPAPLGSIYTAAPTHNCLIGSEVWTQLCKLADQQKQQEEMLDSLRTRLMGVANACSTRKSAGRGAA